MSEDRVLAALGDALRVSEDRAFAALGDPLRWAVVVYLSEFGPLPTSALVRATPTSRQGLTKHLQVLAVAGLIRSERVGRDREWRVDPAAFADLRHQLAAVEAQWDARLDRLRALVETAED